MKGDFSRDTFSSRDHYTAVLMQQGRVQVDADWNEQQAINRHRTETGAADLIGANGGQAGSAGFEIGISEDGNTLTIGRGNYYVDGILCQNEEPEGGEEQPLPFEDQPDLPGVRVIDILKGDPDVGLVYLDVWERHLTALDDEGLREVALGGPDTATRSRTVWQAKVLPVDAEATDAAGLQTLLEEHVEIVSLLETAPRGEVPKLRAALARTNRRILDLHEVDCDGPFDDDLRRANPPSDGKLLARSLPPASAESPCVLPPNAGYERLENQLYRVEIHRGGERGVATFKWSRDNGSVATAVLGVTPTGTGTTRISVQDLGRDETFGFANGQYVELVNDNAELNGQAGAMLRISDVDEATRTVTVEGQLLAVDQRDARDFHYKLRRWDSVPGDRPIPAQDEEFVDLEGGIQVRFSDGLYNTGDYWLIPARTATGTIEWPEDGERPPAGPGHRFSRLALVMAATVGGERRLLALSDCRPLFAPLTELTSLFLLGGDGQEAGSGQPLPRPLVAGVANGDRPVVGARVRFEVHDEDLAGYDGELEADDETGKSVVAITDENGEARCSWKLATGRTSQQVKSSLVDGTHLTVYFNANLSALGEAVAETIQITGVRLAGDQDLRLDGQVPVTALAGGIEVVCTESSVVDNRSIDGKPTCFVTLEMPWPQTPQDRDFWGEETVGFQPLILGANVDTDRNVISWDPAQDTGAWLRDRLFQTIESDEILARLTLKGNFIWDEVRPQAYLDGDIFGARSRGGSGGIELQFPSGDGRRGGDFEMWFRLVPQTLILDSVIRDTTEITGGTQTVNGTVRITGTAPAGGVSIALTSDKPNVASVPASATIPAGQSSATFQVSAKVVAAATTATITATLNTNQGSTQRSVALLVRPPVLSSVAVNPTTVIGKTATVQGTITLTGPAPTGGVNVALGSSNPTIVGVPASVNVAAGSTTAQFTVSSEPVGSPTAVTITASGQGVQRTAALTVQPPVLTQLTLNPTTVTSGATPQGTVTLNGPAPANFVVTLQSANTSVATVPASVAVAANATSATFAVNAQPVTSAIQASIVASRAGVERTAALTVQPPVPVNFTLSPATIGTSGTSTGTITLNGPAPAGTSVTLVGSNAVTADFPASVSVPANATQVTFSATGKTFTGGNRSVTVTVSYLGGTRTAVLTVLAAIVPASVTVSPTSVVARTASQGTVTLTGTAPTGGVSVALSSSNPAIVKVPSSVFVPAGSTSVGFAVNTEPVTNPTTGTITASSQGAAPSTTLTVQPPALSGFSFSPTSISGGSTSTGTITLNGPAPSGTAVTLARSNTTTANVPASVSVPVNATQVTFSATGQDFFGSNRSVTVTATYLGGTRTATLTVFGEEKPKEDKEEKDTKEGPKELAIAKEIEDFSISRSAVQGTRTTESQPPADAEEEASGDAEDGGTGRAFVRPAERAAPGQRALDQPPADEEV
jgi:hypothetical protein